MSLKIVDEQDLHSEQLRLIRLEIESLEKVKRHIDATSQVGYHDSVKHSKQIAKLKNQLYKLSLKRG